MSANNPADNKPGIEPSVWTSDDDLSTFALPVSSSSVDIQSLVRRYPLIALIAAVWLGIGIGKLTRLV
jgi:hypothetical protein